MKKKPWTFLILCLCLIVAYGIYTEKYPPENDIEQKEQKEQDDIEDKDIELENSEYAGELEYSDYDKDTYQTNPQSESSYTSDITEETYGYDRNDPYYSAHDLDGDGRLTEEEWQDAMSDAIDDLYEEMYGD